MDFTGTEAGITAFQMDCKIQGVSREIMAKAMEQAQVGRLHILEQMNKTIDTPRDELSQWAPESTLHINPDRIRDLIGPGKVIRGIQETCIKVTTLVVLTAPSDPENTDKAIAMIREITQEAEIGALCRGGEAYCRFWRVRGNFPGTDGLVHISHLAHERVNKVTDVLDEGDEVLVRVIDIDRSGKIRLSRKEALDAR